MREYPEAIETWRNEILNPYCLKECLEKTCCTRLLLSGLTGEQVHVIAGDDDPELIEKLRKNEKIIRTTRIFPSFGWRYSFLEPPCPAYDEKNGKCRVYGNFLKPEKCRTFPLQVRNEGMDFGVSLLFDARCEYVSGNGVRLLDEFDGVMGIRSVYVTVL